MVTFYRRLPKFDYIKPSSVEEALETLGDKPKGTVKVYAGGTDVVPKLKERLISAPDLLVDLKGIPDMEYITHVKGNGVCIGALTTIHSVVHDRGVKEEFGILAEAANSIAARQIQQRGTVAGNVCSAVPSADSAPALLCLGAKLKCVSPRGERVIDIEDFFVGPGETVLDGDELLREIEIPRMPEGGKGAYIKLSTRSRMDLALVGVGAVVSAKNGIFQDVRIGLGAVAPTPIRATKAEEKLRGEKVDDGVIAEAGRLAAEASAPIDDHRASAEYRRLMVEVLVKRVIRQALKG